MGMRNATKRRKILATEAFRLMEDNVIEEACRLAKSKLRSEAIEQLKRSKKGRDFLSVIKDSTISAHLFERDCSPYISVDGDIAYGDGRVSFEIYKPRASLVRAARRDEGLRMWERNFQRGGPSRFSTKMQDEVWRAISKDEKLAADMVEMADRIQRAIIAAA